MKPQFITNDFNEKVAVILPIKSYNKMMDDLEELEEIKAYDKVKSKKKNFLPAQDVFSAIEKKRKKE